MLLWIGLGLLAWAIYSQSVYFYLAAGLCLAIQLIAGFRS